MSRGASRGGFAPDWTALQPTVPRCSRACGRRDLLPSSQVLDVIAPPYTSDFVQLFLPILENDSIAGTIKTEGEHDPVTEFIGGLGARPSAARQVWFPRF